MKALLILDVRVKATIQNVSMQSSALLPMGAVPENSSRKHPRWIARSGRDIRIRGDGRVLIACTECVELDCDDRVGRCECEMTKQEFLSEKAYTIITENGLLTPNGPPDPGR